MFLHAETNPKVTFFFMYSSKFLHSAADTDLDKINIIIMINVST